MQKDAEASAARRAATSENPQSLRRLHAAQKAGAAPYIVLNGSVRRPPPPPPLPRPHPHSQKGKRRPEQRMDVPGINCITSVIHRERGLVALLAVAMVESGDPRRRIPSPTRLV